MPLYKYNFDQQRAENWSLIEQRWGGSAEAKLFNQVNPDPDSYYFAANSYYEAQEQASSPQGLELLTSYRERYSVAAADVQKQREEDSTHQRRKRYKLIEQAITEYKKYITVTEGGRFTWNPLNPDEIVPSDTEFEMMHRRHSVIDELFEINEFSTDESVWWDTWNAGYYDVPERADVMYAAWKAEQELFHSIGVRPFSLDFIEQYAERRTRDEILPFEMRIQEIREAMQDGKVYEAYGEQQIAELLSERKLNTYLSFSSKGQINGNISY